MVTSALQLPLRAYAELGSLRLARTGWTPHNPAMSSMSSWWLEFPDPLRERAFREDQCERVVPQLRRYALFALFAGPAAAIAPVPAGLQWASLALGGAMSGFALAGLWLTKSKRLRPRVLEVAAAMSFAIGLIYVAAARFMPASFTMDSHILISAHLVATATALRLRFSLAAPLCAGVVIAFAWALLTLNPELPPGNAARQIFAASTFCALGLFACHQMELAARSEFAQRLAVAEEKQRSELLLRNILPEAIAERLKANQQPIADGFESVTVLFADVVGFTSLSARMPPAELVSLLDRMFSAFDGLADKHSLEKIKTIGDAYMAVAGLPQPNDRHADAAAAMALEMLAVVRDLAQSTGENLDLRVGLNSGPVVAGVIGRRKFIYDLWGDAVNMASRMESHGVAGAVQLTSSTRALLDPRFVTEARGIIDVKGRGPVEAHLLRG
ncbi:MAG: adenylate/guanylate cyclase domain-containing protein [Deltaproteobacteria bacterium]|nr:adenylate/guanylate cyclase domain-containing protein [Deltaproteobacteria bacterium]